MAFVVEVVSRSGRVLERHRFSGSRASVGRGYDNALVADAMGNVAETATANIFMVKDGAIFTPVANGTFLAGITRARHIANLAADIGSAWIDPRIRFE